LRASHIAVPLVLLLLLGGCATQPHVGAYGAPGFLTGLFHGVVAPLSLIGGLFVDVRIYAFPNSGWWYDFGFLLGCLGWAGGASAASS